MRATVLATQTTVPVSSLFVTHSVKQVLSVVKCFGTFGIIQQPQPEERSSFPDGSRVKTLDGVLAPLTCSAQCRCPAGWGGRC